MPKKYKLLFLLSVVRAGSMLAMEQEDDFDRPKSFESNRSDESNNRSNFFHVDNNRPKNLLNAIKVYYIENKVTNNGKLNIKSSEQVVLVNERVNFQVISVDKKYETILSQQLGKAIKFFTSPLIARPIVMIKSLSNDSLYHNKLANVLLLLTFDALWVEGDENQYCYVNIKSLEKLLQKQKEKLGNVKEAIGLIQTIKVNAGQIGQNQTYCHVDITPLEKEKFGYKEVFEFYDTEQDGYTVYYNNPLVVEAKSCQEENFDLQMKHYKYLLNRYNAGFPREQNQILEVSKRHQRKVAEQNRYKAEQKIKSIEQQDKEYLDWVTESRNKYTNDVSNYEKSATEFGEQTAEFNKQTNRNNNLAVEYNEQIKEYINKEPGAFDEIAVQADNVLNNPIAQASLAGFGSVVAYPYFCITESIKRTNTFLVNRGIIKPNEVVENVLNSPEAKTAVVTAVTGGVGVVTYPAFWLISRGEKLKLDAEYAKKLTDDYNKQANEYKKQANEYSLQTEAYNKLNDEQKMKTEEYNNEVAKRAAEYNARQAEKAKLTQQLTERPNSNCVIS